MKEGWEYKKLGEVCDYPSKRVSIQSLTPNQYVGVENLVKDRGGVKFSDLLPKSENAIEYITNDILIGNIRPYLKKIWLSDNNGGASGDIVLIRTKKKYAEKIEPKYLYLVLSSDYFFEYDNKNTKGAKMPRGDRKAIAQYVIPLPPLSEQQSIVAELDKINEVIDLKKAQLKDLDLLAQSIFYEMFGDPIENPKGWEVKKLGEVYLMKAGKAIKAKELSENYEEGLVPCFGGNGIRGYIPKVSHTKSSPIIGRQGAYCGTVNFANAPFYATEHAVVVNPIIDVDEIWSYYCLSLLHLEKFARGQAQPGIAVGTLAEEAFTPLPPLPLQQSFASKIQAIESQKSAIKQSLAEVETLLASRMDYWFG